MTYNNPFYYFTGPYNASSDFLGSQQTASNGKQPVNTTLVAIDVSSGSITWSMTFDGYGGRRIKHEQYRFCNRRESTSPSFGW
ncbi:MAG: hypothetical protein ACYCQJ_00655 [Nitrososphaerales archaeon]